jgi:hypothetical protein
MNARRVALDVLCDVHQNGAFASLSLDEKLRAAKLRPEDRRLVTSIVYGNKTVFAEFLHGYADCRLGKAQFVYHVDSADGTVLLL